MYVKSHQKLLNCNLDSIKHAIYECARLGLKPNDEDVYLLPLKGNCEVLVGYHGYVKMFFRNPKVKNIYSFCVREDDEFDMSLGTDIYIKHKVSTSSKISPIKMSYAVLKLDNGEYQVKYAHLEEIEVSKQMSKTSHLPDSPWNKFYEQMAQIVSVRKMGKMLGMKLPEVHTSDNIDSCITVLP